MFLDMEELKDEQLVALSLRGQDLALTLLFNRYLKSVYGFIYRYLGSNNNISDLTQEVMVKVWRNLKKFNQKKSFKTWIFSIAKNTAIDFVRRKKDVLFSEFDTVDDENVFTDSLADPTPLPPEIFERQDLNQDLEKAISLLAPKYRLILALHYFEQMTLAEIAESLKVPINTIKSRHLRALAALRELLVK